MPKETKGKASTKQVDSSKEMTANFKRALGNLITSESGLQPPYGELIGLVVSCEIYQKEGYSLVKIMMDNAYNCVLVKILFEKFGIKGEVNRADNKSVIYSYQQLKDLMPELPDANVSAEDSSVSVAVVGTPEEELSKSDSEDSSDSQEQDAMVGSGSYGSKESSKLPKNWFTIQGHRRDRAMTAEERAREQKIHEFVDATSGYGKSLRMLLGMSAPGTSVVNSWPIAKPSPDKIDKKVVSLPEIVLSTLGMIGVLAMSVGGVLTVMTAGIGAVAGLPLIIAGAGVLALSAVVVFSLVALKWLLTPKFTPGSTYTERVDRPTHPEWEVPVDEKYEEHIDGPVDGPARFEWKGGGITYDEIQAIKDAEVRQKPAESHGSPVEQHDSEASVKAEVPSKWGSILRILGGCLPCRKDSSNKQRSYSGSFLVSSPLWTFPKLQGYHERQPSSVGDGKGFGKYVSNYLYDVDARDCNPTYPENKADSVSPKQKV